MHIIPSDNGEILVPVEGNLWIKSLRSFTLLFIYIGKELTGGKLQEQMHASALLCFLTLLHF